MKFACLALFIAASWLAVSAESTNKFAIHLVTNQVPQQAIIQGTAKPDGLRLVPDPVISDADLVAYELTNHTMVVTRAAADRITKQCGRRLQTPFVVLACGERVYVGIVTSPLSSISADVPAITLEPWTAEKNATNVSFKIHRGYPGATASAPQPDPRGDPRIVSALDKLFPAKHTSQ